MPLKVVRRKGTDTLYIRGTIAGQRVFKSTQTTDPKAAAIVRLREETQLVRATLPGARPEVGFARAVNSYLDVEERSPRTQAYCRRLLLHFAGTALDRIDQSAVDAAYRAVLTERAGNATKLRAVLVPLRAILEHAAVRGWCARPAFETPKQRRPSTAFLKPAEATALVQSAAPHLKPLLIFLLGTGCRLGEALGLTWRAVDLHGARVVVRQKQGEAGHDNAERRIDLPPVVRAALAALPHREGAVFRPERRGKKLRPRGVRKVISDWEGYRLGGDDGGGQIKRGWATACRNAGLPGRWREWIPKGATKPARAWVSDITPHDLRHTWASWDYAIHRDLLGLKARGGWGSVSMVERYAHLMPDAYAADAASWWKGVAIGAPPAQRAARA